MENLGTGTRPYNIEEIRKNASNLIMNGPVTKDYPLDLTEANKLLNEALASEILCVLRYRHHEIIAKGIDFPQVADEFHEHALDEEKHMLMIAERIDQLGGDPDFNPANITARSGTEYGQEKDLRGMIREDLVAERVVIDVYRNLIAWFESDPTTRRMFEKILEEEEEHANDLADLLTSME